MKSRTSQRQRGNTAQHGAKAETIPLHWPETLFHAVRVRGGNHQADDLSGISRRGLWSLQLFLLISCAAFQVRDFNLYTTFPENVLRILGCPPPPVLVLCALAGYIVTVLIPLTIHQLNGENPTPQWRHLGYRSAFYLFFLWSGTLTANFVLVFAAGISLYLLEQFSVCVAIAKSGRSSSHQPDC